MEENNIKISLGGIVTTGATLIGGTAGILIWIFTQYIIPLQISNNVQKITELEKTVKELQSEVNHKEIFIDKIKKDLASATDKSKVDLAAVSTELKKSIEKLKYLESKNLFVAGNPYPYMLDKVKIGDKITRVNEVYPKEDVKISDIEQSKLYYEVKNVGTVFSSISYSYDRKTQKITSVSFSVNDDFSEFKSFMLDKATESLGAPYKSSEKNNYRWTSKKYGNIYLMFSDTYQIMNSNYVPIFWED